jgi:site-specific recombinase XerD
MPGLYRKKRHYYGVFYAPERRPRQKWVALRTQNKRVASARLRELEYQHAIGEWDPWTDAAARPGVTIEDAIAAFQRARESEDLSPNTRRAQLSALNLFADHVSRETSIAEVSADDVRDFLGEMRGRGCKPSSLMSYYTRLAHFFTWCVDNGFIRTSPARSIKRPRKARTTVRFLSKGDAERLLSTIRAANDREGQWLGDIIRVALGTGLRVSELCAMRWDWIGFHPPSVTVRRGEGFRPKSHHERHIPIAGDAADVLLRLHRDKDSEGSHVFRDDHGRPLRPGRVSKAFKKYARQAGLSEAVSFHTLRHTYASWMVKAGADLYRVKELLGHADIETTQRYAHLRPESLRAAVETAFGSLSPSPNGSQSPVTSPTNE